jgi:hypothetical protein
MIMQKAQNNPVFLGGFEHTLRKDSSEKKPLLKQGFLENNSSGIPNSLGILAQKKHEPLTSLLLCSFSLWKDG